MSMAFLVEHDPVEHGHLITVSGELDMPAAPELSTVLTMSSVTAAPVVILDLTLVSFVDSTGLGVILRAADQLEHEGRRLLVVAPDGAVARLLAMTNLTERFTVFGTREEALAAIRPTARARTAGGE